MFKVQMSFDYGDTWYDFGKYNNRDRANEIAIQVKNERDCWIRVQPC